jgi:Tol biopolymer transport system component
MLVGCSFTGASASIDAPGPGDTPKDTTGMEQMHDPTCWDRWHDHSIKFATPAIVPNLGASNTSDRDPALSYDELTLYFASQRGTPGDSDLYFSTRPDLATPFGNPGLVPALDTSAMDDSKMTVPMNGLDVVYSSHRAPSGSQDLWQATRANQTVDFSNITTDGMTALDDGHDQYDPTLTDDGLTLYYSTFIDGQSKQVISMSTRVMVTADFASPSIVINSMAGDADPYLSPDQTVLVFSSARSGGQGGIDLYYTVRAHVSDPWGQQVAVLGANTSDNDGDPVVSRDGCTLLLSSDRDKGNDTFGIYSTTALP